MIAHHNINHIPNHNPKTHIISAEEVLTQHMRSLIIYHHDNLHERAHIVCIVAQYVTTKELRRNRGESTKKVRRKHE